MASNDPTETGGLFIGRRPGTAPLRYREQPERPRAARAGASTPCWPAGSWPLETLLLHDAVGAAAGRLAVGRVADLPRDGLVGLGILVAFVGMLVTILVTLAIAMRLDRAWKIVRRASGHEQKDGMLESIFVISMVLAGIAFAGLVPGHPGAGLGPRAAA